MMRILLTGLLFSISLFASQPKYLLMEPQVRGVLPESVSMNVSEMRFKNGTVALRTSNEVVDKISHAVHHVFNKCGGFFSFDSHQDLMSFVDESRSKRLKFRRERSFLSGFPTKVPRDSKVQTMVDRVQELPIRQIIEHLSSYHNRYYQSQTGVDAAKWIADHWSKILAARSDASVDFYKHRFAQPSVIAKIEGKSKDAIVIGGHLDSIAGFFSQGRAHAPGADDNASGIATITEVMRLIAQTSFKPNKTIFFMGYAGEEKGLLGSKDIAREFTSDNFGYNIKAAIQFDMTNFNGSSEEMYFITDHTDNELTNYLANLNNTYIGARWGKTKCGYACSDHASWTAMGVPAAFPFESTFNRANPNIHKSVDLISKSNGTADHAVNFAKLGLAFALDFAAR